MARQHEGKVVKFMLISILVNLLYSYIKANVYTKVFVYGQPLINIKKTTEAYLFMVGIKCKLKIEVERECCKLLKVNTFIQKYLFFSLGKFCMGINKEQIFLSSQFESM